MDDNPQYQPATKESVETLIRNLIKNNKTILTKEQIKDKVNELKKEISTGKISLTPEEIQVFSICKAMFGADKFDTDFIETYTRIQKEEKRIGNVLESDISVPSATVFDIKNTQGDFSIDYTAIEEDIGDEEEWASDALEGHEGDINISSTEDFRSKLREEKAYKKPEKKGKYTTDELLQKLCVSIMRDALIVQTLDERINELKSSPTNSEDQEIIDIISYEQGIMEKSLNLKTELKFKIEAKLLTENEANLAIRKLSINFNKQATGLGSGPPFRYLSLVTGRERRTQEHQCRDMLKIELDSAGKEKFMENYGIFTDKAEALCDLVEKDDYAKLESTDQTKLNNLIKETGDGMSHAIALEKQEQMKKDKGPDRK